MALKTSCLDYIGKLLAVQSDYGWGWSVQQPDVEPAENCPVPAPMQSRLKLLYLYNDELHGGVGVIETPGHPFDGFWMVFYPRHDVEYGFTDAQAVSCMLWLGAEKPTRIVPPVPEKWTRDHPYFRFGNAARYAGYGRVAAVEQEAPLSSATGNGDIAPERL